MVVKYHKKETGWNTVYPGTTTFSWLSTDILHTVRESTADICWLSVLSSFSFALLTCTVDRWFQWLVTSHLCQNEFLKFRKYIFQGSFPSCDFSSFSNFNWFQWSSLKCYSLHCMKCLFSIQCLLKNINVVQWKLNKMNGNEIPWDNSSIFPKFF